MQNHVVCGSYRYNMGNYHFLFWFKNQWELPLKVHIFVLNPRDKILLIFNFFVEKCTNNMLLLNTQNKSTLMHHLLTLSNLYLYCMRQIMKIRDQGAVNLKYRVGISLFVFSRKSIVFCEQKSDSLMKIANRSFERGTRRERFPHSRSFLKSNESPSLTVTL